MWFSSYRTNATCHPDDRTDFRADRHSDTGHANCNADTATNIDTHSQTDTRCYANATTDDASTRLDATYS